MKSLQLIIIFTVFTLNAIAQAPAISYQTPQSYLLNSPIALLMPNNSGGAVPATIYGQVTTFAGGRAPVTYDATGTGAGFNLPSGITVDASGILYVSDYGSGAIRKITQLAVVTTIATGVNAPSGLVIDNTGNIFITKFSNNTIYELFANGSQGTFAGSSAATSIDGSGTSASFDAPGGISLTPAGNLIVVDQQGNKIRMITPAGLVTTIAGTGSVGANNGPANTATFNNPDGSASDKAGNIYVADTKNNLIREITIAGIVNTFAGSGAAGNADGTGTSASFNYPTSISIDASGNLFVTDYKNNEIRKITPQGVVTTLAGSGATGSNNGVGAAASFFYPLGSVVDHNGNLFITDQINYLIREISLTGYTIDKTLPAGLSFDPTTGIINGTPTTTSPPTNYTITAYNSSGSSVTIVNIQVVSSTVTLKPSIITFPPPTTTTADANDDINPDATSTNNETPVMYSSSNPAVATITSTGLIHLVGPGIAYITATQNGNNDYSPATPVTEEITVTETQVITFPSIQSKTICDADFSINAISSNNTIPLNYTSSNPAVATISALGVVHITGTGTTTISVTQQGNSLYETAVPQSQILTVTAPASPAITITADHTSICNGTPVTYTAAVNNISTNLSYQWQLNGNNVGTNNPSFTNTSVSVTDIVQCIVTSSLPCLTTGISNSITGILVNPNVTPAISIASVNNGSYCSGATVNFTATPTNGGTDPVYQWQINGQNAGTNDPSFTSTTLNNGDVVTCILTNNSACSTIPFATSNAINIMLIPADDPAPLVTVSATATTIYAGLPITFTATTLNVGINPIYEWQVNSVDAGTNSPNFTSSTLNNGDKVTCIVHISSGCTLSVTGKPVYLNILSPLVIKIPNAFTPNGDGINDFWDIPDLSYYPNSVVSIYSRYGAILYHSKGYTNHWDGTYNGKPLPAGTYYYLIDLNNKGPKLSGYVEILR